METCPACNAAISPGEEECRRCGAPLLYAQPPPVRRLSCLGVLVLALIAFIIGFGIGWLILELIMRGFRLSF